MTQTPLPPDSVMSRMAANLGTAAKPDLTCRPPEPAVPPEPRKLDERGRYEVRPGDTLGDIAVAFKVSLKDLKRLNPHLFIEGTDFQNRPRAANGHWIYPGDVVKVKGTAPTDEARFGSAAIAKAKKAIDAAVLAMAGPDGQDKEKAEQHLGSAQKALTAIPRKDPERALYERKVKEIEAACKALHAPEPVAEEPAPTPEPEPTPEPTPEEPQGPSQEEIQIARMRGEVDTFLKRIHTGENVERGQSVLKLLEKNPQHVTYSTAHQKTQLIEALNEGGLSKAEKNATFRIFSAAQERGELSKVVSNLDNHKVFGKLISRLDDSTAGVLTAKLFHEQGIYTTGDRYKRMDDNASGALLKALGFVDPPKGKSEALQALPEAMKQHMINELKGGMMTWGELHMIQWINQHVDSPQTIHTQNGPVQ